MILKNAFFQGILFFLGLWDHTGPRTRFHESSKHTILSHLPKSPITLFLPCFSMLTQDKPVDWRYNTYTRGENGSPRFFFFRSFSSWKTRFGICLLLRWFLCLFFLVSDAPSLLVLKVGHSIRRTIPERDSLTSVELTASSPPLPRVADSTSSETEVHGICKAKSRKLWNCERWFWVFLFLGVSHRNPRNFHLSPLHHVGEEVSQEARRVNERPKEIFDFGNLGFHHSLLKETL